MDESSDALQIDEKPDLSLSEHNSGSRFERPATRSRTSSGRPILCGEPSPPKIFKGDSIVSSIPKGEKAFLSDDTTSDCSESSSLPANQNELETFSSPSGTSETSAVPGLESMSKKPEGHLNYYTCQQCNKFFWTENSMRHHFSMYHSEKAFVCEICNKAFRFRSNLAEHRSVHTSVKPYVCKYCGKSSRLKGNLTKHILKHHKQETNAVVGKEDIIIKKGKKSIKDPKCVDFLEKSMIVLNTQSPSSEDASGSPLYSRNEAKSTGGLASSALAAMACQVSGMSSNSPSSIVARNMGRSKCSMSPLPHDSETPKKAVFGGPFGRGSPNRSASVTSSVQSSVDAIIESALSGAVDTNGGDHRKSMTKGHGGGGEEGGISAASFLESSLQQLMQNQLLSSTPTTQNHSETGPGAGENGHEEAMEVDQKVLINGHGAPTSGINRAVENIITLSNSGPSGKLNTQCYFCRKHFRKASNLEEHLQSAHGAINVGSMIAVPEQSARLATPNTTPNSVFTTNSAPPESGTPGGSVNSNSNTNPVSRLWPAATAASKSPGESSATSAPNVTISTQPLNNNNTTNNNSSSTNQGNNSSNATATLLVELSEKLHGLNGCQRGIQDIKEILGVLRTVCTNNNRPALQQPKAESLLTSLDSRVSRVERQMEASLSTLGTLIQVQTSMNLAMSQFRSEIVQKVTGLSDLIKSTCFSTAGTVTFESDD